MSKFGLPRHAGKLRSFSTFLDGFPPKMNPGPKLLMPFKLVAQLSP